MANKKGKGGFQPGVINNPSGRPKGTRNVLNMNTRKAILNALNIVSKDLKISKGKSFWVHICEQAYKDNSVAIALLKKFCPDLQATSYDFGKNKAIRVRFELIESDYKATPNDRGFTEGQPEEEKEEDKLLQDLQEENPPEDI